MTRAAAPALNPELIVLTALEMTARSAHVPGMRELAGELGVTPGALYKHLKDRAFLVEQMVNAVMSQVIMQSAEDEPDPWQRIRGYVHSLTAVLDQYPGLDRLVAEYGDLSPAARARQRWCVRQFRECGLSQGDARRAYGVLSMYWLGSRQPPRQFSAAFDFGLDVLIDGLRRLT